MSHPLKKEVLIMQKKVGLCFLLQIRKLWAFEVLK